MRAIEVILKLEGLKNNDIITFVNRSTKEEIDIIREHGIFKLIVIDGQSVLYFDACKKNMMSDTCINVFNGGNEIARIGTAYWEVVE